MSNYKNGKKKYKKSQLFFGEQKEYNILHH